MSLKDFHLVFITLSILCIAGSSYWAHSMGYAGYAVAGFIGTLGLIGYEIYFVIKMKTLK